MPLRLHLFCNRAQLEGLEVCGNETLELLADRQVDALEVQHRIAEELRQILLSKFFPCPGKTGCQSNLNMEGRDVQILVGCRDHIIRWVVCFMCTLCVVGMTSFALLIWLVISLVPSCCSQYFANIAQLAHSLQQSVEMPKPGP